MNNPFKTIALKYGRDLAYRLHMLRLRNRDFTIISNDCCASLIYTNLRMQKDTPTCDMTIGTYNYINFCRHLKEYLTLPVDEPTEEDKKKYPGCNVPIGILHGEPLGLRDVGLVFTHYQTLEEAREKWYRRRERVHYDNLFFILDCGTVNNEKILDAFEKLPYPNKVIFTDLKDKKRWKNTFRFSYFTAENPQKRNHHTIVRFGPLILRGIDEFDYVGWLNRGRPK